MNDPSKRIQVNPAAVLNLKAELFRKQEEYKQEKLRKDSGFAVPKKVEKKPTVWDKKNKGVLERAEQDLEARQEEDDALKKSREALEAKSKLYDKLTQEKLDNLEESNQLYLVDFERKVLDGAKERRRNNVAERNDSHTDNKSDDDGEILQEPPPPTCPEEEWVEFVDSLGRTRRCLREDLPHYQEMDRTLQRDVRKPDEEDKEAHEGDKWDEKNDLVSDDMRMELERRAWEEDAEAEVQDDTPVGPTHYQSVHQQEIRDHGVGYFAFSTAEEERKQQLENLQNLRKQTENQREQSQKMKERRKALLEARLAKVKQRKKMQLGIEESESSGEESEKEAKDDKVQEADLVTEDIGPTPEKPSEKSKKKVRPWDMGKVTEPVLKSQQKRKMPTEREWLEGRRNERLAEFAPPQFYSNPSEAIGRKRWFGDHNNRSTTTHTPAPDVDTEDVVNIPLPGDVL